MTMEKKELRDRLIGSLGKLCDMEFFNCVAELYQGEALVLDFLLAHEDIEINPSLISAELNITRGRVTAALSALRKKGCVVMDMSPADRRRMVVKITMEGAAALRRKVARLERYFDLFVKELGEKKAQELLSLVELSVKVMDGKAIE